MARSSSVPLLGARVRCPPPTLLPRPPLPRPPSPISHYPPPSTDPLAWPRSPSPSAAPDGGHPSPHRRPFPPPSPLDARTEKAIAATFIHSDLQHSDVRDDRSGLLLLSCVAWGAFDEAEGSRHVEEEEEWMRSFDKRQRRWKAEEDADHFGELNSDDSTAGGDEEEDAREAGDEDYRPIRRPVDAQRRPLRAPATTRKKGAKRRRLQQRTPPSPVPSSSSPSLSSVGTSPPCRPSLPPPLRRQSGRRLRRRRLG